MESGQRCGCVALSSTRGTGTALRGLPKQTGARRGHHEAFCDEPSRARVAGACLSLSRQMSNIYEGSPLGDALLDSVHELIQDELWPPHFYDKAKAHFNDHAMSVLSTQEATEANGASIRGSLAWYRFVDSVYTFLLANVTIRGGAFVDGRHAELKLPGKRKVVAVDR